MKFLTLLQRQIRHLTYGSLSLALCMVLPFLTGQIPEIGSALCPMHIPVLLSGFLCGPWWAMAVGALAPLLRFALFGMPPIFPTGVAMCFELATYGLVSGVVYARLSKRGGSVYAALLLAMVLGRVVWGAVMSVLSGAAGTPFTWAAFLAGAFTGAAPGIVAHLILIPLIVFALRRNGVLE